MVIGQEKLGHGFNGKILVDSDDSPFCHVLEAAQSLRRDFPSAEIEIYVHSPKIDEKTALEKWA